MVSVLSSCGEDAESGRAVEDSGVVDAGKPDAGAVDSGALPVDAGPVLPGTDQKMTLMHGGAERVYWVHVPASYDGKKEVPLVLDLHGLGGSAEFQQVNSGWLQKSDEKASWRCSPKA